MSNCNTLIRSTHALGLAAWFGSNLTGTVRLNGAADAIADRTDRTTVAASWAKWAPVNAAAIGIHAIGGTIAQWITPTAVLGVTAVQQNEQQRFGQVVDGLLRRGRKLFS